MKKIAISIGIVAIAAATACSKETPVANSPTVPERGEDGAKSEV